MPYLIDEFDKWVDKKMYLSVKPFGWIWSEQDGGVPLEFGWMRINKYDPEKSLCMRVKGTNHFWAWFKTNFIQLSNGNYAELFTKQLEEFRIDFLLWIKNPDTAGLPWVGEYYEMFKGRFYDFSEDEQREYEESQREFDEEQAALDRFAEECKERKRMSNKEN